MGRGRAGAGHHFQERCLEARGGEGTGHTGELGQARSLVVLLPFDPCCWRSEEGNLTCRKEPLTRNLCQVQGHTTFFLVIRMAD